MLPLPRRRLQCRTGPAPSEPARNPEPCPELTPSVPSCPGGEEKGGDGEGGAAEQRGFNSCGAAEEPAVEM